MTEVSSRLVYVSSVKVLDDVKKDPHCLYLAMPVQVSRMSIPKNFAADDLVSNLRRLEVSRNSKKCWPSGWMLAERP